MLFCIAMKTWRLRAAVWKKNGIDMTPCQSTLRVEATAPPVR